MPTPLLPFCVQYYDMPSPSLRNALYKAMQSNVAPFKASWGSVPAPAACQRLPTWLPCCAY